MYLYIHVYSPLGKILVKKTPTYNGKQWKEIKSYFLVLFLDNREYTDFEITQFVLQKISNELTGEYVLFPQEGIQTIRRQYSDIHVSYTLPEIMYRAKGYGGPSQQNNVHFVWEATAQGSRKEISHKILNDLFE